MLRIKSTIYLTGQANNNDRNSKSQTKKMITLPPAHRAYGPEGTGLEFRIWSLRFIWNLVLGLCVFRHKTPGQNHLSLTWHKGPGFSWQNKYEKAFWEYRRA
jgi:hypothetical protein